MKNFSRIFAILILLISFLVLPAFGLDGEQKAIDLIYKILRTVKGETSAVWNEKAKTSDGTTFPCQRYEVSQYGIDFKTYGPPVAYSSSVTFSKPEDPFSGLYLTIYIVNDQKVALDFLKAMSADWVVNGKYEGFKSIELKISDTRSDFLLICGKYIIREERLNTTSLKKTIALNASILGICVRKQDLNVSGVGIDDPRKQPEPLIPDKPKTKEKAVEDVIPDKMTAWKEPDTSDIADARNDQQIIDGTDTGDRTPSPQLQPPAQATPFEKWMNSWNITVTASRSKYIFENISPAVAPPGGGDRMIVLKPKSGKVPAMLEGKFRPENRNSILYIRLATARRPEAAAVVTVEVNGFPARKPERITANDGWTDISLNVGAIHPSFISVVIKVFPDSMSKTRYDYIFIDQISISGKPYINKHLKIVKSVITTESGDEPFLGVRGLWTDLKNRSYIVKQTGNSFTFSCSAKIDGYIWEAKGNGQILSEKSLKISFTEKYPLYRTRKRSSATGTYDKTRKTISWNTKSEQFPTLWFFIK